MRFKVVNFKFQGQRKEREYVIVPGNGPSENVIFQGEGVIGSVNLTTGKGILNTKGEYFIHLNACLGAKPFQFPAEFVEKVKEQVGEGYYGPVRVL